jgi:ribosomal protein L35
MDNKEYICKRCNLKTTTKGSLVRHLQSKNICKASHQDIERSIMLCELTTREYKTITIKCEYCNKIISKPAYSRHIKTCKNRKEKTHLENVHEHEFQKLKAQVVNLQQLLSNQYKNEQSTSQVVNNCIINNTYVFNLNSFGQEDTSHLSQELLSYCINNPKKGMSSLIESIHYNDEVPANHNLRCKSLKKNIFEKFVGTQWIICDASNTLDELIRKGYRILESYFSEHFMTDPTFFDDENRAHAIQRFRNILTDTTCQDYHAVKRDLRLLILDK